MIVKQITPLQDKVSGKDIWRVEFEGDTKLMWLGFSPSFSAGSEIEDSKLQLSKSGKCWIFKRRQETKPSVSSKKTTEKSYTADPQKIESIEFQNARNNAVTLYCQVTKQGDEFDNALLTKLYKACETLGKDVISVAKKEYHAVEADK